MFSPNTKRREIKRALTVLQEGWPSAPRDPTK
jgi:hypothetical protein